MTPAKRLSSDGRLISIIIWCSYSGKMKVQYMNNTFHVAQFHIKLVLLMRNSFKQAKVPNKLGRFGTGIPIAPVWQSCGQPSTKFPHGELVECVFVSTSSYLSVFEVQNFQFFLFFLRNSHFSKFPKNWDIINLVVVLRFSHFNTFISIFNIRSTRFSLRLYILYRAKPCQLDKIRSLVHHFSWAPVWRAWLLFRYGNRAVTVNRQPSFRTEDS